MPGLIRGVARTAVVAGTATAVSNRVSRRQSNRWAQQAQPTPAYISQTPPPQQYAPAPQHAPAPQYAPAPAPVYAPAPAPAPQAIAAAVPIEQLQQLGALHEQGILTDEEFAAQKAKLLGT